MSTTFATSQRRTITAPTTTQSLPNAPASLRLDTGNPTALPSFEVEFSLIELDTAKPTPSATIDTETAINPATTSSVASAGATCAADSDCTSNTICTAGKCTTFTDASPLGGLSDEPTSRLSTKSAIGAAIGAIALIALLFGFAYWYIKVRGTRTRKESIEAPSHNRGRSASNATDQKTLVASLPNSPQNAGFQQRAMPSAFFTSALGYNGSGKQKAEYRTSGSSDRTSTATNKALPLPPLSEYPLPPPPTEPKRYAINVNINKSMIFDDEVLLRAVSPLRDSDCDTTRERTPKYRFEEYLPSVAKPPPISITRSTTSSKRNSEYELDRYPNSRKLSEATSTTNDVSDDEGPRLETLPKLESKPRQLPSPGLQPPSPSFSFRSYDWYQDIIGDQASGERTPTQASFPQDLVPNSRRSGVDGSLDSEPLSFTKSSTLTPALLHPESAASSASPDYRLSPTVYVAPARSPKPPPVLLQPPSPPPKPKRISALSTNILQTHNSRSWAPDDGLYLPEEGTMNTYEIFRRPSDSSRPTSYSPLS